MATALDELNVKLTTLADERKQLLEKVTASESTIKSLQEGQTKSAAEMARLNRYLDEPVYKGGNTPARLFAVAIDNKEENRFGFKSIGEQLHSIRTAYSSGQSNVDKRLGDIITKSPTGMNEAVGNEGGFPLAPTFVAEIMEIMHLQYNLLDEVDKHEITSSSVKINANDETSRVNGSRRGGIRGYWVGEGDTLIGSKPKWRQITLNPHKLAVLYYATEELLADSGTMLSTSVSRWSAEEIAFLCNDAVINGDGVSKPLGILGSGALISVAKETGQTAATIMSQNVVKMFARMHVSSRANATWWINQEVEAQLPFMTIGTAGAQLAVYIPPGGLGDKPYGTLLGRPVRVLEQCAALGTVGDIMFVDPKQYLAATRGQIQSTMSIHVAFLTDEQVFKLTFRVDGQPWWAAALTPYRGSSTQSPFIALATRA